MFVRCSPLYSSKGANQISMHRTLLISEIQLEIFSYLSRNDLASSCFTCKAWTDTALDFIWKTIEHAQCLFDTLFKVQMQYVKRSVGGSFILSTL